MEKEPYATTMQKLTVGIVKRLPIESHSGLRSLWVSQSFSLDNTVKWLNT